jgi:hypothetical protein
MPFNKLQKFRGMLVKNLFIGSFIDLFMLNITSIVNILFILNNHVIHYYAHFYNEKWVGERVRYMNIILF